MSGHISLEGFVAALCAIPPEEFAADRVLEAVRANRVAPQELEEFLLWRPDRYTRNLVYRNDLFQVLVMCWNIGQASPVHDHAGQRCWMSMEEGRLEISNYSYKRGEVLEYLNTEIAGEPPDAIHVDQCNSIHQISNRCSWCQPAVSLHVYSLPFGSCYIYDLATGSRDLKELGNDIVGPLAVGYGEAGSSAPGIVAGGPPAASRRTSR